MERVIGSMSAPELRECPFCGKLAAVQGGIDGGGFYVACLGADCFCCVGEGYDRSAMSDHSFPSPELAIAAWNTRATPDAQARHAADERIAVLTEAVKRIAHSAGEHGERGTSGDGHNDCIGIARAALGGRG